ncbi:hypothetical protein Tco_0533986 [Tanacetum coccineum]
MSMCYVVQQLDLNTCQSLFPPVGVEDERLVGWSWSTILWTGEMMEMMMTVDSSGDDADGEDEDDEDEEEEEHLALPATLLFVYFHYHLAKEVEVESLLAMILSSPSPPISTITTPLQGVEPWIRDVEDSRSRISHRVDMDSQRVDLLMGDRMTLQETVWMVEEEAYASREAWDISMDLDPSLGTPDTATAAGYSHSDTASGTRRLLLDAVEEYSAL